MLFRKHSYHGTSVRDIAKALGVPQSAIYYYFPSKEDLLFRVVHGATLAMTQGLEELAKQEVPPAQKLAAAIRYHLKGIVEYIDELLVLLQDTKHLSSRKRKQVIALRDRYEGILRGIVAEGVAQGAFRNVDPKFTALCILGMCNWVYNWYKEGQVPPHEIADIFCNLILGGLLPGSDEGVKAIAVAIGGGPVEEVMG
jgi:AcrR family transcriptional regulator